MDWKTWIAETREKYQTLDGMLDSVKEEESLCGSGPRGLTKLDLAEPFRDLRQAYLIYVENSANVPGDVKVSARWLAVDCRQLLRRVYRYRKGC